MRLNWATKKQLCACNIFSLSRFVGLERKGVGERKGSILEINSSPGVVEIYNEINILLQSVSPLRIGIVQIKLTFSQQQFSTWLLRKAFREADGWNPDSESASMWGNQGEEEDTIGQVGHAAFLGTFSIFLHSHNCRVLISRAMSAKY